MDNREHFESTEPIRDDEMFEQEETQQAYEEQGEIPRAAYREAIPSESIAQTKRVIDMLEQRINEGRRIPLSKGMCIVDAGSLVDLIGQLRIALPKAVLQAQDVLESAEQILEQARTQADKTADEADAIYKKTVGEANQVRDEIHAEADAYQKQTHQRAEADANAMIADANTRAEQILFAAQQQAQQMLEENEITRRAQAYALEIRDRAQKDAQSICDQAYVQSDKLLSGAAAALTRSANELAAQRDSLLAPRAGQNY